MLLSHKQVHVMLITEWCGKVKAHTQERFFSPGTALNMRSVSPFPSHWLYKERPFFLYLHFLFANSLSAF